MRAVLLCLLAGCLPEVDDAVVIAGRHITVHAAPTIPVCEDAIAVADRFIEDTAALLGFEPRSIDYYLFDGRVGCGFGKYANASCTIDGRIYANVWIHFHELVHGVDRTRPPALFVEGLAEALSTPSDLVRSEPLAREHIELDFESTNFRAGTPFENYRIAGDFVRFLLERFGAPRYVAFARSLISLSDHLTIRRTFERAFGESLDDVVVRWRASSSADSTLVVPVDLAECHDTIAPIAPETWSVDDVTPNHCTSGTTPDGTSYVQHPRRYGFDVAVPGIFLVQVTGTESERGKLRSCTADAQYSYATSTSSARFATIPLHAGRHAIEMIDGVTAWRVERLGGFGDTCTTAPSFAVPSSGPWLLEAHPRSGGWLHIANDAARPIALSTYGAARACTGLCHARACQPIAHGTKISEPSIYIVFESDHAVIVESGD